MQERKTTVQTINQAIEILAYNEHFWENFRPHDMDVKTVRSLAESQYPYTEKQGKLAVALIKRYHTMFLKHKIDLSELIAEPVFREPFRVIDYNKSLEVYIEDDKRWIEFKFPYNKKIIELLRVLKARTEKLVPAIYDGEAKKWKLACTEITLYFCVLMAIRYDFKIVNPEILDEYEEIKKEKLSYRPTSVTLENGKIKFNNATDSLTEWWNNNIKNLPFIRQVDALKQVQVTNDIEFEITEHSTLADRIAVYKDREVLVDRDRWTKRQFVQALEDLGCFPAISTAMDILHNYRDVDELFNWYHAFETIGVSKEQIAWGYTLEEPPHWDPDKNKIKDTLDDDFFMRMKYPDQASESEKERIYNLWYELHLDSKANKHIDENTKLILVRNRIPRTLIKSGIKPQCSFSLTDTSYWPTGTESLGRLVDRLPKRIYYSSKNQRYSRDII